MKAISALCLGFLVAALALADEKAVHKYRNFTPEQIRDLPEKARRSEVPMMYTFAAQRALSPGSTLLFAMELNRLMYPGIHNYTAAVKAFQTDLGDKPTGILTVWQIHSLEQRAQMQQIATVAFPQQFSSFKTDDYATVQGTVTLIDEQIAWPINHVKVTCFKRDKECRVDQINLLLPDEKSWAQTYTVMYDTESYEISQWGQDSVDASFKQTPNACRTTALNFNFKTKEFFYITRNAGGDCEFMGTKFDRLPKPRIAKIVDGSNIIAAQFAKIQKAAYEVLSSDLRREVDKFVAKSERK